MATQKTYQKNGLTKLLFAIAFLIVVPFSTGYAVKTSPLQQKTKTELVVPFKNKTPGWIKSFHKKTNLKTFTKSLSSKNYEAGYLFTYNKFIEVKFDNLSQKYYLIKSPGAFFQVKTIPQSSEENDFISLAG